MAFITILILLASIYCTNAATLLDQLAASNATTFLSLVKQAGLASQLTTGGPFTLLVPTDAAFAKIPAKDLAAVTKDSGTLLSVLNYHMSSGLHKRASFLYGRHYFLNSTNGHVLRVYRSSSGLHFNQATAVKTDITASNGVIHLINTVLDVPEGTIVDVLQNPAYNTSKFFDLIKQAHLDRNYANPSGLNRYTVFAPSDAAVAAIPQDKLDALSKDYTNLRLLIEYHVHSGTLHASSIAKRHSIRTTLPDHNLTVATNAAGVITLDGKADVVLPDIEAENGVVHVISEVLFPQIIITDVFG